MRYKVVTVAKPTSCCTDRVASLDSDIEEVCNDMASRGFVLVSAFDFAELDGFPVSACLTGDESVSLLVADKLLPLALLALLQCSHPSSYKMTSHGQRR